GVDAFERVELGDRNMLHRRGVDDEIDAAQRHFQTVTVADVADEIAHETKALLAEFLGHIELLLLVAREDDHLARLVLLGDPAHEMAAEGARAAGDKNHAVVQVHPGLGEVAIGQLGWWAIAVAGVLLWQRPTLWGGHSWRPSGFSRRGNLGVTGL